MNSALSATDSQSPRPGAKLSPWLSQAGSLFFFVAVCFGAAAVGGSLTAESVSTWYRTLTKPSWNPPNWIFGPVWTVLYFMMGVAAWLVWRRSGWWQARFALLLFAIQLVLNIAWSGLFFAARAPGLAFAEILLLWISIAATIAAFDRHSRAAAAMLVPYLAWSTFAAALNFVIWRLNG